MVYAVLVLQYLEFLQNGIDRTAPDSLAVKISYATEGAKSSAPSIEKNSGNLGLLREYRFESADPAYAR